LPTLWFATTPVHGITVIARDVTALRRNEARFTELFETLQEGIYIVTPRIASWT